MPRKKKPVPVPDHPLLADFMSPGQFIQAQADLGYRTNKQFAVALGISEPSVEKYRAGDVRIRKPIARLIRYMLAEQASPKRTDELLQELWETPT